MPFAAALALDGEAEARVRALQRTLFELGLGHEGVLAQPPHMTLAVAEQLDVDALSPRLTDFAAAHRAVDVELRSVGVYKTGAVFLSPVITAELLALHREFRETFGEAFAPAYGVGSWDGHCTLSIDLPPEQLGRAVSVVSATDLPIRGRVARVFLAKYWPADVITSCPLASGGESRGPA
jgi:2'-5' RNA ligase